MPNPACEHCKPDRPDATEGIVKDTGCTQMYDRLDTCMKANNGNVASCRIEWSAFTECFKASKLKPKL